jgi:tetratricopeptide (TPR) repeat protein
VVEQMSKDKIKEDLKREYDKSGAGIGGLMRSMGLGPSDSDFDRMADEIARSKTTVTTPSVTFGTGTSSKTSVPPIEYSRIPHESDYSKKQKQEKEWARVLSEIEPFRSAARKLWDEGQYKDAESYYKQGLDRLKELYPDYYQIRQAFYFTLMKEMGELYLAMGQRKKAKKSFEKILNEAWKLYKDYYSKQDAWKDYYNLNYGALWGWEIQWDSIAWLFMFVDDYKKVTNLFKDALKKDPEKNIHKEIIRWARLGAGYLALGKADKATEAFKHAKALSATDEALSYQITQIIDTTYQQFGPEEQKGDILKKAQPNLDKLKSLIAEMNELVDQLRDLGLSDKLIREYGGFDKIQPSSDE